MLCASTLPELESSRNFRAPDILLSGAFQWIIVKLNCFYGLRFVDKVDADCNTRETIVSGNDNEQSSVSKQVNKLERKWLPWKSFRSTLFFNFSALIIQLPSISEAAERKSRTLLLFHAWLGYSNSISQHKPVCYALWIKLMKMRKKTGIDFLSEDFMAPSSSDTKANKQVSWCYEFE